MRIPLAGTGIPVNHCLDIRIGLNLDINWDPVWQVLLSRLDDVTRKTVDFRLAVELSRNRHVHAL